MSEELKSQIISGTMTWGKWGMNLSPSEMIDLIEYNDDNPKIRLPYCMKFMEAIRLKLNLEML